MLTTVAALCLSVAPIVVGTGLTTSGISDKDTPIVVIGISTMLSGIAAATLCIISLAIG